MKTLKTILVIAIVLYSITCAFCQSTSIDFPILKETYLGQKPPGKIPELFAAGFISNDVHDSPKISVDEKEMIIPTMGEGLKYYKMTDGNWLEQQTLPFIHPEICNGIFYSPSGKRIYFLSWENNDENFYFIEKIGDCWSEMKSLGDEVNSFDTHWQFSTSNNENLYFPFKDNIMVSNFDGEKHLKPVYLKMENNENLKGTTPFISPDESYLIYSIRKNETDKFSDLYISYRLNNNKWSNPIDLGSDINCRDKFDLCPIISPDGKYLFFISRRLGSQFQVFWVDAGFIEELKPTELINNLGR